MAACYCIAIGSVFLSEVEHSGPAVNLPWFCSAGGMFSSDIMLLNFGPIVTPLKLAPVAGQNARGPCSRGRAWPAGG